MEVKGNHEGMASQTRDPTLYTEGGASTTSKVVRYWNPQLKIPDEDIIQSKKKLMARSLALFKNNSIAAAAIKKIVANVVGPGLKVKSTIDAKLLGVDEEQKEKLEKQIETLWEMWTRSTQCDYRRMSNFSELQSQYVYAWLIFGEGLAILPSDQRTGDIVSLKIDLVENHRLEAETGNNFLKNIVNGVELDNHGRIAAYHFSTALKSQRKTYSRIGAYDALGRKNVLCLFTKERVGQRVGLPVLTPVITDLKRVGQWQKAEIDAAVTTALHPIFIKRDLNSTVSVTGRDEEEKTIVENGEVRKVVTKKVEGGSITELSPGESVEVVEGGRNAIAYDTFLITTCKTIGAALELPYEVLLTAFSSNYSASRAAILEAWKMYLQRRARVREAFCEPIYEQFIDEIVARGYIDIPGYFQNPLVKKAVLRAEWYGPIQGSIDPKKEAEADAINLGNGTKSRARIARENGTDWDQTVEQLAYEERVMREKGVSKTKVTVGGDSGGEE